MAAAVWTSGDRSTSVEDRPTWIGGPPVVAFVDTADLIQVAGGGNGVGGVHGGPDGVKVALLVGAL